MGVVVMASDAAVKRPGPPPPRDPPKPPPKKDPAPKKGVVPPIRGPIPTTLDTAPVLDPKSAAAGESGDAVDDGAGHVKVHETQGTSTESIRLPSEILDRTVKSLAGQEISETQDPLSLATSRETSRVSSNTESANSSEISHSTDSIVSHPGGVLVKRGLHDRN